MTAQSIISFFDRYADAFSRLDVEEIGALWGFPAVISTPKGEVVFTDADAFQRNTEALCAFYGRQGVASVAKAVVSADTPAADVAYVRTADEVFDHAGKRIAAWEHAYLLRERGGEIQAVAAIADNEIAAWSARGTPLGG